jgi:hypothetical protein
MSEQNTTTQIARDCAVVFSSEQGARVLDWLVEQNLARVVACDANDQQLQRQEGRRTLVLHLLQLVETGLAGEATGPKPAARERIFGIFRKGTRT